MASKLLPDDTCWGIFRAMRSNYPTWSERIGAYYCERVVGHLGPCGPKAFDDSIRDNPKWPSKAAHVIPPTRQGV